MVLVSLNTVVFLGGDRLFRLRFFRFPFHTQHGFFKGNPLLLRKDTGVILEGGLIDPHNHLPGGGCEGEFGVHIFDGANVFVHNIDNAWV